MFRHHTGGKNTVKGENAGNVLQKKLDEDNTQFYINLYIYFQRRAQAIMNINWDFTHEIKSSSGFCSALCCMGNSQSAGQVHLFARLTKPLYFTDE